QAAARQEAARQAAEQAARQAAAATRAAQQEAAERREARLREIGRQLDEERAQRDAAAASARQSRDLPHASSQRRGRLMGRSDPNPDLVAYGEAWARKIQLDSVSFERLRELLRQPHFDALVTVAVRADGSVESVSFVRSSGSPALDAAIERTVRDLAVYPPFPPALARDYDVIEIRRSWHFDSAIRLY
ncbi:MAG TPA: TonB family protein, partial [Burkholderiaceae bacterium]|nr:TonB family protein [Burkholderiaceae bacterium]